MDSNKQMRAHYLSKSFGVIRIAALVLVALAAAGCSGGSSTEQNPVPDAPTTGPSYVGPAAANNDIQAFRTEFWENVRAADRCGGCHNATGQAPSFARSDDVNQAFQQAVGVINRENPSQSLIVTKVAGGHNCWRGDPDACAAELTRWISKWVGSEGGGGKQIQLVEPDPVDPGVGKRFDPTTPPMGFDGVYNILDQFCSGCHQSDSATAQSPFFAQGNRLVSSPAQTSAFLQAYQAAIPKINLNSPAESRLVVRLANEKHNCWTNNCASDAAILQQAIETMANAMPAPQPPTGHLSKALGLYDGTVASGGNRYETNMIALYEFKKGSGGIAADTSGVAPAADLEFTDPASVLPPALPGIEWVGGWGLNIKSGSAKAKTATSRKFHQMITATGEYSIEAWVAPANVTQEDARIVSYSGSDTARNFTMGQHIYSYEFAGRSSETDANGGPRLSTDNDAELLQATLQHVVMTFDPVNGRRIYINGEFTGDVDGAGGGTLESWDNSFAFLIGNEAGIGNAHQWQGVVRLVAVYNRALNLQQIKQNFEAGVGEKFFLLFGVSHLIDVPKAYIMFEGSQYDTSSYLFNHPKFISLDPTAMPGNIHLEGMRIGVNGVEAQVGQAYRLLKTDITNEKYSAATGQLLSSVGTIIPVEQGPMGDEFFLCFDQIGTHVDGACTEFTPGQTPADVPGETASDIGVKLFDAINATMASITGVSPNQTDVKRSYNNVRQSLPAVHDIKGYLSSHQTAVAQLALTYCNVMMNDSQLRNDFFPGVDFSGGLISGPSLSANGQLVVDTLRDKAIGSGAVQPDDAEFDDAVGGLVVTLCTSNTCTGTRTVDVIKAACGASLGSAATMVQ